MLVIYIYYDWRTCTPKLSCEMASISLFKNRGRALLHSGVERSQPIMIGACTQFTENSELSLVLSKYPCIPALGS
jgi:hypothetical protein